MRRERHDGDAAVRLAATRAARLRTVEERVRSEPDNHVRLGLVRVLATWAPAHPEVAPALAWVGEHDREEAIRGHARQGLPAPAR